MFIIESPDEARGSDSFGIVSKGSKKTYATEAKMLKANQK